MLMLVVHVCVLISVMLDSNSNHAWTPTHINEKHEFEIIIYNTYKVRNLVVTISLFFT